jgi:hypothetical protein
LKRIAIGFKKGYRPRSFIRPGLMSKQIFIMDPQGAVSKHWIKKKVKSRIQLKRKM